MELILQLGMAAPIALFKEPLPRGSSFGKSLQTGIEGVRGIPFVFGQRRSVDFQKSLLV